MADRSQRVASTRPSSRRGVTKSQIRAERRQRSAARRRRRRTVFVLSGSFLAIIFIVSLTLTPGLGNQGSTHGTGEGGNINTGGPVPLDFDDGRLHVGTGVSGGPYTHRPATSGSHWNDSETPYGVSAPARWGVYDEALPDEILIHNLEHGGIGLHYDCPDGCDDLVATMEDFLPRNKAQFIMSPYSGIENGHKIAITAWLHHLYLDEWDAEQVTEFIEAYQDRAPESVPGNQF